MAQVSVIVPAAGSGQRFGGQENKIFAPLAGRAIFLRTLDLFCDRPDVLQVLLVVSAHDMPRMRDEYFDELAERGVWLIQGGDVRSQSVRNALEHVDRRAELIAVHDAVRPCVSEGRLDEVFATAARTGAAMLAYPVHGTLKRVDGEGVIRQTVSREGLWEAQTPQVFDASLLRAAYAVGSPAPPHLQDVTDDAQLLEMMGREVHVVLGDPRNVKITTPGDLLYAHAVHDSLRLD